jgi:hypothetical protein
MGFLGLFGSKKSALEKHSERVANKRAQAPDRWEAIQGLGKIACEGPEEERSKAVDALLERFTFYADPTITDGDEKDEAFRWILEAGADAALPAIRRAMRRHESLSWPLKCLEALTSDEDATSEMLELLSAMGTEYQRDPQRKLQLLGTLEQRRHPTIAAAVSGFFEDVNETARFHAAGAALAQEDITGVHGALIAMLRSEESVRVKTRVLEGFSARKLSLGSEKDRPALSEGWSVDSSGVPRRALKP